MSCRLHPSLIFFGGSRQVGNYTVEKTLWDRPESYSNKTAKRPAYYVTTKNGTSDLVGQMIGALVSTAMVFQDRDPAYSERLMDAALKLYGPAVKNRGRYTRNFIYKCAPEVRLLNKQRDGLALS